MQGRKIVPVALLAAGAIALLGACGTDEPSAAPTNVVQTAFPDLTKATGEPTIPGLESADPEPGQVVQVKGPFDDRFELSGLTVQNGTVAGDLTVTSDVSHLLDLQVVAGFYDAEGAYLGSARFDRHTLEEPVETEAEADHDHETAAFSVEAPPEFRNRVSSAAIGVPVLVNE